MYQFLFNIFEQITTHLLFSIFVKFINHYVKNNQNLNFLLYSFVKSVPSSCIVDKTGEFIVNGKFRYAVENNQIVKKPLTNLEKTEKEQEKNSSCEIF